jgi:hypothetical protein
MAPVLPESKAHISVDQDAMAGPKTIIKMLVPNHLEGHDMVVKRLRIFALR